ncbi:hypothetical protein Hypma_003521 [Hypsizygus marmoreus]|uniref:Protein kinase domain-containing protein n=1 Tax=Hypsizygus marmoreus TaxID=39966 RepID=A0A369J3G3_HYPMA|nr:hypothetical protein Hypma_003521 [Hypsizygus marmoreus]
MGDGSTDIVHSAMLELKTLAHRSMSCDVVFKFAFTTEQQRRLRNEYSIYGHLSASGVTGVIVGVLGLFEDIEGAPLALIMSHGGISEEDRGGQPSTVEARKSESMPLEFDSLWIRSVICPRTAFLQAVESILGTGIQHNDLRTPNLLVNESGGLTCFGGHKKGKPAEMSDLLNEIYGLESDTTSKTGTSSASSHKPHVLKALK